MVCMVVGFPIYNHICSAVRAVVMMVELMLSIPQGLSCSSSSQDSCIDEAEASQEQMIVAVQCRYCDEYCCTSVRSNIVLIRARV